MGRKQPSVDNLAKLQAELEETTQQRSMALAAINRTQPTTRGYHMADVADDSISQQVLLEKLGKKIFAIQNSIARINQGTYGICIDCRRKIAKSRLEVHPTAKRCVTCQENHENGS
jgi:DnaK suppressor protein